MPRRLGKEERLADFMRLRRGILAANDPEERRARIADLVRPASPWPELALGVDTAIETGGTPDPELRSALRVAFARCCAPDAPDHTAIIRTGVIRLLGRGAERDDLELFRSATETYLFAEDVDVAAEMRALALRALASIDHEEGRWAAARLVFDSHGIPNQEPNRTAVDVLAKSGDHTLLLHWLDHFAGTHPPEAAALAEDEIAVSMPIGLWARRAAARLGDARPRETLGAVAGALRRRDPHSYPALRLLLLRVRDVDLFRAVALTLATSRDAAVHTLVLGVADEVDDSLLSAYLESVEACRSPAQTDALATVKRRLAKRQRRAV